jgi:hypothetical protein
MVEDEKCIQIFYWEALREETTCEWRFLVLYFMMMSFLGYVASNGRMIELKMMNCIWKEVVVT